MTIMLHPVDDVILIDDTRLDSFLDRLKSCFNIGYIPVGGATIYFEEPKGINEGKPPRKCYSIVMVKHKGVKMLHDRIIQT